MARILLTGFEPFGDFATNPSWDALELAQARGLLAGLDVTLARIPVVYDGAFGVLQKALAQSNPQCAISFGLHGGLRGREADTIYIETTWPAHRDGANKPDSSGQQRPEQPSGPGAPRTMPATLDTAASVTALQGAKVVARTSDNAGAYLCNHLFFRGARALQGQIAYGFVHVPPVKSMGGNLNLEQLARAVALIARTAAASAGLAGS